MAKRGPKPKDVCSHGHDMRDVPGNDNLGKKPVERSDGSEAVERFCIACKKRIAREYDEKQRLATRQRTLRPDIRVMEEIVHMRGLHDLSGAAGVVVTTGWISA